MIPDYCEPLIGYRVWNVFPNGLMAGQSYAEPWPPYQAMAARCGFTKSAEHVHDGCWVAPPVYRCGCGIHALKRIDAAELRLIEESLSSHGRFSAAYIAYYDEYTPPMGRVWGSVKFWGRVVEHEIGYRAEYAYPSQLYCQDPKLAATVAELYGVPCDVKVLDIPTPQPTPQQWYTVSASTIAAPAMTWGGTTITTTTGGYNYICPTTSPLSTMGPASLNKSQVAALIAAGASKVKANAHRK